ncbi:MAG: M1 family metallopeptidase [Calditrichia bacterium]
MFKPTIVLLLLLCLSSLLPAQRKLGVRPTDSGGVLLAEQASYDVTYMDLQVAVDPPTKSIQAELSLHATIVNPVEWLVLDLDTALIVDEVTFSGYEGSHHRAEVERRGNRLWIHLHFSRQPGSKLEATIRYHGKPKEAPAPPWVGGFTWSSTESGEPWIATSMQSDGADLWFPCKDHPSDEPDSMHIRVTVPKGLIVASNGVLQKTIEEKNDKTTFHWFVANPINNYNVALNIAPYVLLDSTFVSVAGDTMPFQFYVRPERLEKGKILFMEMMEHVAFYERLLGPYPFRNEKYGVAETPFLGMEHQTIIAYGNEYKASIYGYDLLHHHELGHEWWGNLVTALDWRDFWLHEGHCAYMHGLYNEERDGEAAYHAYFNAFRPRIRNLSPVAPRESQTATERYFLPPDYLESDGDVYNKGSLVLHALRFVIGKENMLLSLRRFAYPTEEWEKRLDGSQCRFVTTDDYLRTAESIYKQPLDWFFEVYLRNAALPELEIERVGKQLTLKWKTVKDLPFPMPLEISIDGNVQRYDFINGELELNVPSEAEVKVDPKNWVLKKMAKNEESNKESSKKN